MDGLRLLARRGGDPGDRVRKERRYPVVDGGGDDQQPVLEGEPLGEEAGVLRQAG